MVQISEVPNEEITHLTDQYVDRVHALNSDPYFQEATMKFAIRELVWDFLERFRDKHALAEQLRVMADLVEQHDDDRENA